MTTITAYTYTPLKPRLRLDVCVYLISFWGCEGRRVALETSLVNAPPPQPSPRRPMGPKMGARGVGPSGGPAPNAHTCVWKRVKMSYSSGNFSFLEIWSGIFGTGFVGFQVFGFGFFGALCSPCNCMQKMTFGKYLMKVHVIFSYEKFECEDWLYRILRAVCKSAMIILLFSDFF